MMLQEITQVPLGSLPMIELRAHLRMGSGFGEETLQDPVLEGFLRAAQSAIEARVSKALIARDFVLRVDSWSRPDAQVLPLAPVSNVHEVVLRDREDTDHVVSPELWRLKPDAMLPEVAACGGALPGIPSCGSARISFTAGYGSWRAVPADLQQAVFLLAAHYYEHRNETQLGAGCMPFGVTALLERYRVMRIGFGGGS